MKHFNFNMKAIIKFNQNTKNTTPLKQNIFRLFFSFALPTLSKGWKEV